MDTASKALFVQQCYKLITLSHMSSKAFQIIYQNNLYGLVSDSTQSPKSAEYELKVIKSLSEISISISDMCLCMEHGNSDGFNKIFEEVSQEATILVSMFNEINDAASNKQAPKNTDGDLLDDSP
jgi:hypothetical protein